jgi:hypothetical protein
MKFYANCSATGSSELFFTKTLPLSASSGVLHFEVEDAKE